MVRTASPPIFESGLDEEGMVDIPFRLFETRNHSYFVYLSISRVHILNLNSSDGDTESKIIPDALNAALDNLSPNNELAFEVFTL